MMKKGGKEGLTIPSDVLRIIALFLRDGGSLKTLGAMTGCSKDTWKVLTPILYAHLVINPKSAALFEGFPGAYD